ncbi:HXXEE domain-containing protein [Saccharopolyspora sp. WRP15-2]|uniref:HXXEE domain-containing protein n=1 Tax=Saccharopolyspora oryzae TaxID=2997343 RepID=A0ABT4UWP7_9PSEU|nr:HXXEE domain-containing protein [Saccharopolyspora oryzae]MDA3626104.1 HXXEE domain-containing protein [Saccharopolyspora oryzae]
MTKRGTACGASEAPATHVAVPAAATWGLLVAFAAHDAEELATMPWYVAKQCDRLQASFPGMSPRVLSLLRFDRTHAATAIGLMGGLIAAAAAAGAGSEGRSAFYQTALAGFGLHAVTHVGQSAVMREYTPGVVTASLVVAPFSAWAWWRLKRAGVVQQLNSTAATAAAFPVALLGVHCGAYVLRKLARGAMKRRR